MHESGACFRELSPVRADLGNPQLTECRGQWDRGSLQRAQRSHKHKDFKMGMLKKKLKCVLMISDVVNTENSD